VIKSFTAFSVLMCSQAAAQEPAYHAQMMISGFLMRSAAVCPNDKKITINTALDVLKDEELRTFVAAFPQTAQGWAQEGSGIFNSGVLKDGISSACRFAAKARIKAALSLR
jgi:hypothetical protein